MILPSPSRCLKYNLWEWELHFWFGPLVLSSSDYLLLATSNFSSSTTNPKLHLRSPPIFSGVHFVHSVVFCVMFRRTFVLDIVCPFGLFLCHSIVCPYDFWLSLWYLQTFLYLRLPPPPWFLAVFLFVLMYLKFSA